MKKLLLAALMAAPAFAHARPPQDLKFPPLRWNPPEVARRVLSNGATVFLLPDSELPLVQITALVRTGTMYDPPALNGLAQLCGTMLRAGGTRARKVEEIDEKLEYVGASVETSMDMETGQASLSVLRKDLDLGLEIFADVLMNPAFAADKIEIEKAKMTETIRRRNDEPFQIARRELRKMIYGPTHPMSRTPEIPTVRRITRDDLDQFYRRYFAPNNTMFAVSGDFKTEDMVAALEAAFSRWRRQPVTFPEVEKVAPMLPTDPRTVGLVDKPLNQASVLMGHLGVKRHSPDHFALEVLNEILGGSAFSSRLYREVRTRRGLAYWVGSSLSEPYDLGLIAAGCQTKNQTASEAVQTILDEMARIKTAEVSADELKLAKDSLINSFVFRYASSHAIATQTMTLEYFGFPRNYLDTYTDRVADIDAKAVLAAAKKYLHPDLLRIVVVGDAKQFDAPVSQFGELKTLSIEIPQ